MLKTARRNDQSLEVTLHLQLLLRGRAVVITIANECSDMAVNYINCFGSTDVVKILIGDNGGMLLYLEFPADD